MNILLLNDTSNWYHFGCTATSYALIEGIKRFGHKVTTLPITSTYNISSFPNSLIGFNDKNNINKFIQDNSEIIELLKKNDILVINGEGTLHGLNKAPLGLLYLAYITKIEFGKVVQILNHSAYPEHNTTISNNEASTIYKLVYSIVDFISIREPFSYNTMKKLGINATESFDCLPLYIKNHYFRSNIKKSQEIIIAGSATWLQLNIPSKEKGNINEYTIGLMGLNEYLLKMISRGFKIKFLYGANSYPAKDDQEFIEYMQSNFLLDLEVYNATSLNDWLRVIEEATLLISGRFHHTIAAACFGTDFIALNSNTPKMEGLMEALGSPQVIYYNSLDIYERLIKTTNEILNNKKQSLSRSRQTHLDYLCNKANKNFEGIRV